MESECRRGELEMELRIVRWSQMFRGVPVLYESRTNGQGEVIESFISTMEKDGWRLEDQDGTNYIFRKKRK